MLIAVNDLRSRKRHFDEIFAERAGKRTAQHGKHIFAFLLRQQGERLVELRDDFLLFVDVAPAHMGDIAFIRPESAANFRDFFFVHFDILLFLILFLKTH